MTAQELKNSILQLAIRGKLVEQRPEEGTAEELYRQIQSEKAKLLKAGKIKKEKPLPEITEDEIPFEIPETWKWVRLDDIVGKTIKRGKSPTYTVKSNTLVFAQKCNTKKGCIDLALALYLDESKLEKYPPEEFMKDSDIIINSTGNGTLGRVGIFHDKDNPNHFPIVPDSHVTIIRTNTFVCAKYVFYCLKHYQPYMESLGSGSTNQTELNANIVKSLLFPLPPLEEQKRIVAKIEEIFPYIERFGELRSQLRSISEDLRKSILQQAIQGKLVEQRTEEGTAEELYRQIQSEKAKLLKAGKIKKEKPLPEITEDEIPFEIPETWKWCRIGQFAIIQSSKRVFEKDYVTDGIPFFRSKEIGNLYRNEPIKTELFITEEHYAKLANEFGVPKMGDILITSVGTIGNTWICDNRKFYYKDGNITQICGNQYFYSKYVEYFLHSPLFEEQALSTVAGTAYSALTIIKLKNLLIPLPPLKEQKRIVAKIEEVLKLCDKLK